MSRFFHTSLDKRQFLVPLQNKKPKNAPSVGKKKENPSKHPRVQIKTNIKTRNPTYALRN